MLRFVRDLAGVVVHSVILTFAYLALCYNIRRKHYHYASFYLTIIVWEMFAIWRHIRCMFPKGGR